MNIRRVAIFMSVILLSLAVGRFEPIGLICPAVVHAQQAATQAPEQPPSAAVTPLKSESQVVRVDVIVTDKKGNYIHDLAAKDFRVFEDGKPQEIVNLSFGSNPNSPAATNRHYMVLFFDNSTMDTRDQTQARAIAAKFIDSHSGPDRLFAIFDFGGALQLTQNFTSDSDRLKKAVASLRSSGASPNAIASSSPSMAMGGAAVSNTNPGFSPTPSAIGTPTFSNEEGAEANFGAYSLLLAIRSLAKQLGPIPGRKSLVLFTTGFQVARDHQSELTAAINSCNKANVAIYPVDVRGFTRGASSGPSGALIHPKNGKTASSLTASSVRASTASGMQPRLLLASYRPSSPDPRADAQHGGGGGGGGSGGGGGGGGGGNQGGGTPSPMGPVGGSFGAYGSMTNPAPIIPPTPPSASTNQVVLYALADGTGGFPILNPNDLLNGLEKIWREQDEYYLLGYVPTNTAEGSCHSIKVKVESGGINVRARSGYCSAKPTDPLAGKPIEKDLEAHAAASASGNLGGTLEASFFYTSVNEARVNLAMEIPSKSIEFDKVKGKSHAEINILCLAYKPDGSLGARFSDQVVLDLEKDQLKDFTQSPMRYENQFAIAPGQYRLTLVLSSGGQNFGKYETPLLVDPYDGKTFSISGVALSNKLQRSDASLDVQADLLADRVPLLVRDFVVVPSGSNRFKKTDQVVLYAQVYEPRLKEQNPPAVRIAYQIVDSKTGKPIFSTGMIDATPYIVKGNPTIPLALKVPVGNVPPGTYRLDLQAAETGGIASQLRTVTFQTE